MASGTGFGAHQRCPGNGGKISAQYNPGGLDRMDGYAYNASGPRIGDRFNPNWGLRPILFWKNAEGNAVSPVSADSITAPAELLAVSDSLLKVGMAGGDDFGRCNHAFDSATAAAPYALPHGQNYSIFFCDGHASVLNPSIFDCEF